MSPADETEVMVATEEDLRIAVRRALDHAGLTWTELAAQAAANDFESTRARIAWVAIGGLGHLAPADFYEDDESPDDVQAAFDRGEQRRTSRDDHEETR